MKNKFLPLLGLCAAMVLSGCNFNSNPEKLSKVKSGIYDKQGQLIDGYYNYFEIENDVQFSNNTEVKPILVSHFPFLITGKVLGEDKDYYLFNLNDYSRCTFECTDCESDVTIRIYKFGNEPTISPCSFHYGTYKEELYLDPGTYYVEFAYGNANNKLSNYTLKCTRDNGYKPFDYTRNDENFAQYGMVYWQNDISPFDNDGIDDIYASVKALPLSHGCFFKECKDFVYGTENVEFLDSIMYVWDKQLLSDLATIIDAEIECIKDTTKESIKSDFNKTVLTTIAHTFGRWLTDLYLSACLSPIGQEIASYIFDGIELVVGLMLESKNRDEQIELTERLINQISYLSRLREKCHELAIHNDDNRTIRLVRYAKYMYINGSVQCIRDFDFPSTTKYGDEKFVVNDNEEYKIKVFDNRINAEQKGIIKVFRKPVSYQYGTYYDEEGMVLDSRWDEFDSVYEQLDEKCHKKKMILGYVSHEEHKMIYSNNDGYRCQYCGHTKSLPTSSMNSSNFGDFGKVYCSEEKQIQFVTEENITVTAIGKRCGLIEDGNGNQYFTLSSKAKDVHEAYIELYFDVPVLKIDYDFSLWSNDENVKTSSLNPITCQVLRNNAWEIVEYIDSSSLNTKDDPTKFSITEDDCFEGFRIVINSQHNMTSTKARGRFVLDNIGLNNF